MRIARQFVLRRDASILKRYLPPKRRVHLLPCDISSHSFPDEYVVFVTPTQLQHEMFKRILTRDNLDNISRSSTAESLALINILTKISNSPILLRATVEHSRAKGNYDDDPVKKQAMESALSLLPHGSSIDDVSLSGTPVVTSLDIIYCGSQRRPQENSRRSPTFSVH